MSIVAGTYKARAVAGSATLIQSKDKGTPGIAATFEVTEGPHARETVAWQAWFSDKTRDRIIDSLLFCGWQGDDLTKLDGIDSKEVLIVVEEDAYTDKEGKPRTAMRVAWVNDPGRVVQKTMDAPQAQDFAQRMRGAVMAARQKRAATAPSGDDASFNFGANAKPEPTAGTPSAAVKF